MREPKGKISIVMPSGKRMESINNLSEAIKANAEATVYLAKIIENLNAPQVSITGCHITTDGQSPAINISNNDESLEQGVYHYSPTGYTEHDYGYPNSKKLDLGDEIPECYGEEDDTYEESVETFEEDDHEDEE